MVKNISKNEIFLKGCELWVGKPTSDSMLSMQLDFELNYLITKSHKRILQKLDPLSQRICADFDLNINHQFDSDFLLIECSNLLPARWLLIVPAKFDQDKFFRCIKGLNCKTIRFLFSFPEGQNPDFSNVDNITTIEMLEDPGWSDSIKL